MNKNSLAVFEDYKIRRIYDEESDSMFVMFLKAGKRPLKREK